MNTKQINQKTYEELEEIYLERSRYLLNIDDMLEEILLEQELENEIIQNIPINREAVMITEPIAFASNFT